MNFEKHPVHKKFSDRPSVIFPYAEPKKTRSNAELIDTRSDQSEDEEEPCELTNDMLLDLKASFNSIKKCFNGVTDDTTNDVANGKAGQSDVISLEETTVVNSIVTKSVTKNAITQENAEKADVTQENVNKEDVIKDDVINNDVTKNHLTKNDVTKKDVIKNSTENAQTETKRTKTSQKRPSKSNIQFQVPKKLQVKVTAIFDRSFSQIV